MSEVAGSWEPSGLPPRVARLVAQADAMEMVAGQREEAERAQRNEAVAADALRLYAEQEAARGRDLTALELATGTIKGRDLTAIFADAMAAGDHADAIAAARASRDGTAGVPQVFVGEPVIREAARSRGPVGRAMDRRLRHFHDRQAARRAEAAAAAALNDIGLVGVPRG